MGPHLAPAPWEAKTKQKYHSSFPLIYLLSFFEMIFFENRRLALEKGSTGVSEAVGCWTGGILLSPSTGTAVCCSALLAHTVILPLHGLLSNPGNCC